MMPEKGEGELLRVGSGDERRMKEERQKSTTRRRKGKRTSRRSNCRSAIGTFLESFPPAKEP